MTTPVNKALALLLKEKGFDEKCINFSIVGDGKYTYTLYVPTIAEAVMWIYEKYGIWIFADFGLGWEGFTTPCGYSGKATHNELHWNGIKFNSPTEAYEAAIEYVLTNLI